MSPYWDDRYLDMRQDSGIGVLDKAVVVHAVARVPLWAGRSLRERACRATAHQLAADSRYTDFSPDGAGRWLLGLALTRLSAGVADPLQAAGAAVLPGLRADDRRAVRLLPAGGHHPGLRRRTGTACGPSRYRAGGEGPAADDGRLGRQVLLASQRPRHPAGGAAVSRSPSARWPMSAGAAGRRVLGA